MYRAAKTVLVVAIDPATRALARISLADHASHLLECIPEDFEAFMRTVRCDLVVMIGPTARSAYARFRRRLPADECLPAVVVASTVSEALMQLRRPP